MFEKAQVTFASTLTESAGTLSELAKYLCGDARNGGSVLELMQLMN